MLRWVSVTAEMELGIELEDEPPLRLHQDFIQKQAAAAAEARPQPTPMGFFFKTYGVRSLQALLFRGRRWMTALHPRTHA